MTETTLNDPRPAYAAATAWLTTLMRAVTPDQLDDPTPCTEYDVRALSAHLVMTARRAATIAEGGDILAVTTDPDVFGAQDYADAATRAVELWADDALLTTPVIVPWGEAPGAGALWGYVQETLVHGWDLAVATGQNPEADPALVAPAQVFAERFIPAAIRADEVVPFGAVVTPRAEAGPTERLANWTGRESRTWVTTSA
ncbi:TIGR03086 family metal-binding protein [Gordonia sp. ABSL1-1]|uniref:TIGR03086 family metal-binding protein n=1 Tax=Gordonia sp. ABSL1-1 TaxID=3053923 RepID=UPI0025748136|nr:TIGR03086 family metal-binding protein [Gordonia sp. ABSL1-1]MDL9938041.1 TIGR03086 family metal-binding protein [Gordonia sp. ABSL1-1]